MYELGHLLEISHQMEFSGINVLGYINCVDTDLTVQVFPEVLCHEPEEGEKCPAEGVKAGVAIVRITSYL